MNVLVMSGVSAGTNTVGGIILKDLFNTSNGSSFHCYSLGQALNSKEISVNNCTIQRRSFVNDHFIRLRSGRMGAVASVYKYLSSFSRELHSFTKEILAHESSCGVDAVLQIMDTAPLIALGPVVAEKLDVPLYSLVWDPPEYILRTQGWDRYSRNQMFKGFLKTLTYSRKIAVVSDEMASEYRRLGAKECVLLRHGFSMDRLRSAKTWSPEKEYFKIGFAGNIYAFSAWNNFIAALDVLEWKIDKRRVVLRLLGCSFNVRLKKASHVECLGWRDNDETLALLAQCDLNYLPYPFESGLGDLARFSFPTKLSTYAAAGVPVFVHAPEYSSLHGFYRHHPIGVYCNSLEAHEIAAALNGLATDHNRMRSAADHAEQVAKDELNRDIFLSRFTKFLGL